MTHLFVSIGALLAALSVSMGAFAAHGAAKFMSEEQLGWMEKAARYNMYHALALFVVAWALTQFPAQARTLQWAGWSFVAGVALFSGSLYVMSFSHLRLGYITPLGGVAFVAGWLLLAFAAWKG
ncbi:MAG: DUF423 domain-containing protein [Chloroflexi bacterium]|nr:DUF423 domain-containing protein [Chloroflexota bacterium]